MRSHGNWRRGSPGSCAAWRNAIGLAMILVATGLPQLTTRPAASREALEPLAVKVRVIARTDVEREPLRAAGPGETAGADDIGATVGVDSPSSPASARPDAPIMRAGADSTPKAAPGDPENGADAATLPPSRLILVTRTGQHEFTVEIADDPIERQVGLMFRDRMDPDHGMLFDFGAEAPRSFWMKNTILPLDIIFAKADGTIVSIGQGTPFSLDGIESGAAAEFVLELNRGVAAKIGLSEGDRLLHRRIAD